MTDINKLNLAGTKAKGKRPYFLADKQTEQVMSVTMALAMELSVARERMASIECLLENKGILQRSEIDDFQPCAKEVKRRSVATQEYLARILRIIQQDSEEQAAEDELSVEEAQRELTKY
ncbi:hypothetical protein SAMN05216262_10323 [Colwellia chukchiensis]|uniref:Uncharacterized protein n=1 Tax=Colwellia chukchiensis TaxID=641665 RepID=A0A1H7K7J9_9GAMM|nr:hypothetical protein [Colwellia chukchiensis]SEK81885.1 hypothetical protein SAMN05216262_10323 [Colwellia chukchiensis]